jgi:hypothetical protein
MSDLGSILVRLRLCILLTSPLFVYNHVFVIRHLHRPKYCGRLRCSERLDDAQATALPASSTTSV